MTGAVVNPFAVVTVCIVVVSVVGTVDVFVSVDIVDWDESVFIAVVSVVDKVVIFGTVADVNESVVAVVEDGTHGRES